MEDENSDCKALGYWICQLLAYLWHKNTSVKSLKTPSCCPAKTKWYTWAKGRLPVKEWSNNSPRQVLHVAAFRSPFQDRAREMWLVPDDALAGPPASLWSWGWSWGFLHPWNHWKSFENSQAVKRLGCCASVRGSATYNYYPSFWFLTLVHSKSLTRKNEE